MKFSTRIIHEVRGKCHGWLIVGPVRGPFRRRCWWIPSATSVYEDVAGDGRLEREWVVDFRAVAEEIY